MPAQQTPAPPPKARTAESDTALTTIRARAKLVVLDVVVTGKDRTPYKGLTQKDFTVTEGGVPQSIRSFEEHTGLTSAEAVKFPPPPALAPGVFTNFTPAPTNSAVNILLLDALNTPLQDQTYVRDQLLEYIKKARPGTSIAIFGLSNQLHMLQGFTSDPEILREAVKISKGKSSPLLNDPVSGGITETLSDQLDNMGGAPTTAIGVAGALTSFESGQQSFQFQLRAQYTLDALSTLSHYLANIPGRKNLIWFSGSFPINILPDADAADPFASLASFEDEYRETINLLARSQVAVYPIDARGIQTPPSFDAANQGGKYVSKAGSFSKDMNKFSDDLANEHSTMRRMADDTGGQAAYNTNGLSAAVAKAIDNGSNYYTLTYTPTNSKWKGDFRKISVKLAQQGYTLAYRHGYYADDPDAPLSAATAEQNLTATARSEGKANSHAMQQAMVHGLPVATQIIYKVRVLPVSTTAEPEIAKANYVGPTFAKVKGPYRRYLVDYAADPKDIRFEVLPNGSYHCSLEFITIVYMPDGETVNIQTNAIQADIPQERFAGVVRGGLHYHQEISVPAKGEFTLRTGIHDVQGNRIGALELPVAAVAKLPPPPSSTP